MATYLVTGGAGFIGSHLVETLVRRGEHVRVFDNFATGQKENLAPFAGQFELVEGSVTEIDTCRQAVQGVDYVLHQGALPSVPKSMKYPIETHDANVNGTLNLLVAARDAAVKRLVYAASSSAYGDTPVLPKVETMPSTPLSPYAVQKHVGELYCRVFFERFNLETVALRYFNIFGPRQNPNSPYSAVIPLFVQACIRGEAPKINGDGSTSRDFTYIENVVEANLLACTASSAAAGQVFNIACGAQTTLLELTEKIRALVGSGQPPTFGPAREGDVQHSLADISKAEELLGYHPKIKFDEGLRRTVSYYREMV